MASAVMRGKSKLGTSLLSITCLILAWFPAWMSLSARIVARTSSATRLTKASGASWASAGDASSTSNASADATMRIIPCPLTLGERFALYATDTTQRARVPIGEKRQSLSFVALLRRRLSVVDLITPRPQVGIAYEGVPVDRRRAHDTLRFQRLRPQIEIAD